METVLKCGDYGCTRTNVEVYVDDRNWDEKRANAPLVATLKNLRCKVHAAGIKRSKYYKKDLLPLTEQDRERLLKEQAVVNAEQTAKREAAAEESRQRAEQRRLEEWALLDLTAEHALVQDKERFSAMDEPSFEGLVWTGERPERGYEARWLNVVPTNRYYGTPPKGPEYPYIIRVTRGSNLTPNEARALAALLVESANKAEELNAKLKG